MSDNILFVSFLSNNISVFDYFDSNVIKRIKTVCELILLHKTEKTQQAITAIAYGVSFSLYELDARPIRKLPNPIRSCRKVSCFVQCHRIAVCPKKYNRTK